MNAILKAWRAARARKIEEDIARLEALLLHWTNLTADPDRTRQTLPVSIQNQMGGWKGDIAALKKRLEHLNKP